MYSFWSITKHRLAAKSSMYLDNSGRKILLLFFFFFNFQRVQNLERARGSLRRDEVHEFRVGRIKHERVKVPRGDDQLLQWAMQVMKIHADRKAILEVEFTGEEGTGLGPTLEFFALVAAELQSKYFPYNSDELFFINLFTFRERSCHLDLQ